MQIEQELTELCLNKKQKNIEFNSLRDFEILKICFKQN